MSRNRLTREELQELRSLTPYYWEAWPFDEYDKGLPVVEVRQDQFLSLLDEVEECRQARESDPDCTGDPS